METRSRSPGIAEVDTAGGTTGNPVTDETKRVPSTTRSTTAGSTKENTETRTKGKQRRVKKKTLVPSEDDDDSTDSQEGVPAQGTASRTMRRIVTPSPEAEAAEARATIMITAAPGMTAQTPLRESSNRDLEPDPMLASSAEVATLTSAVQKLAEMLAVMQPDGSRATTIMTSTPAARITGRTTRKSG
ncbi:hypothetical protein DVH05_005817 [Phytophthora capsici]|nr:hypothetical protein DVH05_005817 [Phytophthora capsici]